MSNGRDRVLVTGASGFIAKHLVVALLDAGYVVRGTVREASRAVELRAAIGGANREASAIEVCRADLDRDEGWDEAMQGVRYVLHTASPFPLQIPRDRQALVATARGGALRVVEAAKRAGVERLVLTSSVAAVYYGHEGRTDRHFTEADVTEVGRPTVSAYAVSKTLAEQAAWHAVEGSGLQMVSINPALVLGPLLDRRFGSSVDVLRMMLHGRMPFVPDVSVGIVDVRDVALAHVRALVAPSTAGRRFLLSAGSRSLREIGAEISRAFPAYRRQMPRAVLPDGLVRFAGRFSATAASAVPELGVVRSVDTEPARDLLQIAFRTPEDAIRATAGDLLRLDLVRDGRLARS
ncbi:dihydrofolate synthase [Aureimonas sp. Leaf454]|uniref:NAD-dependent epimerase/dehydratase family protein n=1 Tax=Aureimonas sp. Leaf454 TaxID=1736381 RepID=UPI0007023373|nr:NAD-dependent epimerase/dehydratase family protein [Aureimonas sp. Leaf454]KQT48665.1 dihydrofolate synthase [Aureimonas sp. Leaf454]